MQPAVPDTKEMHFKKGNAKMLAGGTRAKVCECGLLIYDLFSLPATQKLMSHRWLRAKR